jgi:paraquat-inducible protein B
MTGEFSEITAKVTAILDNINEIKLKAISDNANNTLSQIAQAAEALQDTANSAERLLTAVHEDKVSNALTQTLENLSTLSKDFSADSETYKEVNRTMQSLQSTLKDLQPLLLQLNSTPNSFIFTDGNGPRLVPKAKVNLDEGAQN